MKKKLLLGLLPAMLVLASCQASPRVEPKPRLDNIVEDTEAHDEIFGESILSGDLAIRKTYDGDVDVLEEGEVSKPVIGIQTKTDTKGTPSTSDDTISIRFVSAIQVVDKDSSGTIDDDELADTNVMWAREIFEGDGDVAIVRDTKNSTKAYTELAAPDDDEDVLTIAEFNAAKAGRNYTHFVVYTLLDLPLEFGDYYINVAVLRMNKTGDPLASGSDMLATTIDQTTQFVFTGFEGYFGVKKTASGFETFEQDLDPAGNHARFLNIPIAKDESFVLVKRVQDNEDINNDKFIVYGYDKVHLGDSGDNTFSQLGTSQFAKAKYDLMKYHIFLSNGGETPNYIYTNCVKRYYLLPTSTWTDPEYENDTNYRFAVYYRVNVTTDWYSMLYEAGVYYADLTFPAPGNLNLIIFCKMWGDNPTNGWEQKRHQTGDLSWQPTKNQYTIASLNDSGEADGANWSVYSAS